MIAKVGDKGRHVQVPDGWVEVTGCVARMGDRFLNATLFSQSGLVIWLDVIDEDVNEEHQTFDCLIRRESRS